jgi:nitroreductase
MVLDIIKNRWSPISFSTEPVEEYKLRSILEAARYAPSSMNEQPWIFILTTKESPDIFNDVVNLLTEFNQQWAKNAYALVVSLARTNFVYKNRPNRHAFHDTGMAVANMLVQAQSMGVYVHQMAGFSIEKTKQYFNLPEGVEPLAVMALGYLGDGSELREDLKQRQSKRSQRKNLSEYTFRNRLGEPAF